MGAAANKVKAASPAKKAIGGATCVAGTGAVAAYYLKDNMFAAAPEVVITPEPTTVAGILSALSLEQLQALASQWEVQAGGASAAALIALAICMRRQRIAKAAPVTVAVVDPQANGGLGGVTPLASSSATAVPLLTAKGGNG